MKKYRVGVKEVWEQMYEVEAESIEQAKNKLEQHLYDSEVEGVKLKEDEFDFDYSLDKNHWVAYDE